MIKRTYFYHAVKFHGDGSSSFSAANGVIIRNSIFPDHRDAIKEAIEMAELVLSENKGNSVIITSFSRL